MSDTKQPGPTTVALIGNPNTGKSTLFCALAGLRQQVGNYPGVTVEKRLGALRFEKREYQLIDLPGTYSLVPRSRDEMIAVDVLLGHAAGVAPCGLILCIVDANNLRRNLYLVEQVLELGLPTVVVVNMIDLWEQNGGRIDLKRLEARLGVPVVATQAHRRRGVQQLKETLVRAAEKVPAARPRLFSELFYDGARRVAELLREETGAPVSDYYVERMLLDGEVFARQARLAIRHPERRKQFEQIRAELLRVEGDPTDWEPTRRYQWVDRALEGVLTRGQTPKRSVTDRIDHLLTHRFWGLLIFIAVMTLMFQVIFYGAAPLSDLIDVVMTWLGERVTSWTSPGPLQSLLVDGVVAGVGGVLTFIPQIALLFVMIALLEDCGYMARAAYLTDRTMSRIGLSGKSFIPLLSSFACAVPGIMAARVIENPRDRLITILIAPLMSCSARLIIYTWIIAAVIPKTTYLGGWIGLQALTLMAMYLAGVVVAVLVAMGMKLFLMRGTTPLFILELPVYKIPSIRVVCSRVIERVWSFVLHAGTIILAASIVVWALAYYPRPPVPENGRAVEAGGAASLENSYLGRAGRLIEPAVRPLGWDWRIGCAVIASFPAREVVISSLNVIYNVQEGNGEDAAQAAYHYRVAMSVPTALSLMVFFALCSQCAATLAVIRRETNSWRWPIITFTYMTVLAYLAALIVYQAAVRWPG